VLALALAIFALTRNAKVAGLSFSETMEWLDLPAVTTDLAIDVGRLAKTDEHHRFYLHDLPIELTNAKPPIVDAESAFYPVTNDFKKIDGVAFVVVLLNKEIDPNFVVCDALVLSDVANAFSDCIFDSVRFLTK